MTDDLRKALDGFIDHFNEQVGVRNNANDQIKDRLRKVESTLANMEVHIRALDEKIDKLKAPLG